MVTGWLPAVLLSSDDSRLVRWELHSHSSGTAYSKNLNLCVLLLRGFTLSERTVYSDLLGDHNPEQHYDHLEQHQQTQKLCSKGESRSSIQAWTCYLLVCSTNDLSLNGTEADLANYLHFSPQEHARMCQAVT